MKAPVEFMLSDDHADVDTLLRDALRKLGDENAADAFQALDLFWARLAVHIRAEHLHLFPALAISENGAVGSEAKVPETLERLRSDHDFFMHELASSIKEMRSMTTATEGEIMRHIAVRLRTIQDRLAEHNAIEEEQIYPLQSYLSARDAERLSTSIRKDLSNLPPRFSREE